jgi:hypothetical protein
MKVMIEVLPEMAKPLYDKDKTRMAVILKDGKPCKVEGIPDRPAVLVPLYPIDMEVLRGLAKTAEFAEKEGYDSCMIAIDPRESTVGIVSF